MGTAGRAFCHFIGADDHSSRRNGWGRGLIPIYEHKEALKDSCMTSIDICSIYLDIL